MLSFLRVALAFIWGHYISLLEGRELSTKIIWAVCLLFIYFCINFAAELIESYMAANGDGDLEQLDAVQANRQEELMQAKIYHKLSRISPEYFEIAEINDKVEQTFRYTSDRNAGVNREVMLNGYIIIAKVISTISIAAALASLSPLLCFIVVVAPIPTLWMAIISNKLRFRFVRDNIKLERKAEYFQRLMISTANKEITLLGIHDFIYSKWKTCADNYTENERISIKNQTIIEVSNGLVYNLINVCSIVFSILLMVSGRISLGGMITAMALIGTLIGDVSQLLLATGSFYAQKNNAAIFFDVMDLAEDSPSEQIPASPSSLKVSNLSYRYPLTERYVLDNISLTIEKGDRIAIVGVNGGGKTTLVKLLTGMLHPSKGEICIDGTPASLERPDFYSVVTQAPIHYTTFSVGENVYLGDTSKPFDRSRIQSAMQFAGCQALSMDDLLGKDVGGIDLSSGQWQMLAIARASYRDRGFIILDEPTSNLDPITETNVFKKYLAVTKDKTVLFVTHRISLAALANRIIVIKDGKIVQDGSHHELIEQDGEYARLYSTQAKWYC